jgi:hypothetical protein
MRHWEEIVEDIKKTLKNKVSTYQELKPLLTFLVNFDRKYRGSDAKAAFPSTALGESGVHLAPFLDKSGFLIMDRESYDGLMDTIKRQEEEIATLKRRIKILLES